MRSQGKEVIVLGDSFNNTLGLIRSLGEAKVRVILILVGEKDRLYVGKSRYLNKSDIYRIPQIELSLDILRQIHNPVLRQFLICSNDPAAEFVDSHEDELSKLFITPMRGHHFNHILDKDAQCDLASKCGFIVPKSLVYHTNQTFPLDLRYPILLKPLNSNKGTKGDIHICGNHTEVKDSLSLQSNCTDYIVQEYIEKEYELNLIGVRTDNGVFVPGGIQKIRHYPTIYSPCSFGLFQALSHYRIDVEPIKRFLDVVGYYGPFSVEFLHKDGKNYFMEFNLRHDGLAYTATAAGCNLLDLYVNGGEIASKVKPTYMMDLSADYNHVKDKHIEFITWIRDFLRTGCQLNFNIKDPFPTLNYYISKLKTKFS